MYESDTKQGKKEINTEINEERKRGTRKKKREARQYPVVISKLNCNY